MWEHLLLCITGLCGGIVIASGTAGLLIGLSIIPRYAGITHTGSHILLYEDSALLGIILGNLACLFPVSIPLGDPFLIIYGFFSGIFLGSWILALAEVASMFPIFARRIQLTGGIPPPSSPWLWENVWVRCCIITAAWQ